MKPHYLLTAALLLTASSQIINAAVQTSLPQFKSKQELASRKPTTGPQNSLVNASYDVFYTGKTFESEREEYLFTYRSYDSELNRWTSNDPMGFPDGSNNHRYVSAPTSQIDPLGLFYSGTPYDSSVYGAGSSGSDQTKWNLGKGPVGFVVGINTLGWAAMDVADGTAGTSSWTLTSGQNQSAKYATEYYSHYDNTANGSDPYNGLSFGSYIVSKLYSSYKGTKYGSGQYSLSLQVLYPSGTDGYFAFGHANISLTGSYSITDFQLSYTPTVNLTDDFTFAPYASLAANGASATGTGYRLQDSGFLHSFSTSGTWNGSYSVDVE